MSGWSAVSLVLFALGLAGCAASAPNVPPGLSPAAGSNRQFSHTVTTTASPHALWAFWTDVSGWPEWDVALDTATLEGPFVVGARGRLSPRDGRSARFRVVDVEPGQSYTFDTTLPLGALRVRRSWAPAGPGRVPFTHEVSFHGLTGWLFAARLGPEYRRASPVVMGRLRELAERQSGAPEDP